MRLAIGVVLMVAVLGILPVAVMHYASGDARPLTEALAPAAFVFSILFIVGVGGWGLQVAGDRVFRLREGTTARYLALLCFIGFVAYVILGL